jgi:putative ABC transport system permease protein
MPVLATTGEFFTAFEPELGRAWKFAEGRAFGKEFEVVVGARAARQTGLRVGDEIFLTHGTGRSAAMAQGSGISEAAAGKQIADHVHKEFTFTIVGVLEPSGGPHDRALFVNLDSSWILHAHDRRLAEDPKASLTTLADVTDADRKITAAYLQLVTRPGSSVSAALQDVYTRLRMDPTMMVAQPSQEVTRLLTIVGSVDQILLAMAVVVLVSSGIAIMLALYNSMEQRRRQIAVLRVLGCSRPRVFGLVLTESALLGVLGAVTGFALCLIGVRLVAVAMKQRLGLVIEPVFGPDVVLAVITGTVALAALAGVIPAVMAYRTSVAKNLKPLA